MKTYYEEYMDLLSENHNLIDVMMKDWNYEVGVNSEGFLVYVNKGGEIFRNVYDKDFNIVYKSKMGMMGRHMVTKIYHYNISGELLWKIMMDIEGNLVEYIKYESGKMVFKKNMAEVVVYEYNNLGELIFQHVNGQKQIVVPQLGENVLVNEGGYTFYDKKYKK